MRSRSIYNTLLLFVVKWLRQLPPPNVHCNNVHGDDVNFQRLKEDPNGRHGRYRLFLALWAGLLLYLGGLPSIALAEARIQTGNTPTTAFLQLGDRILLNQPGFHLSHPQVSPDGRWLAVTVVPSGAGTADFAELYLYTIPDGTLVRRLKGYSPTWSTDSRQLSFENGEGAFVYYLATQRLEQLSVATSAFADAAILTNLQLPLAYPQTIRVAHHPSNGCRAVAAWQVDVIPFESYVAQVLPAEVPASWPAAALAAMAVAARTYAWRQILAGRSTYDVTDWANFQMMCADRYPSTDAAVAATAGQFLTAKNELPGVPISAMYSAENGHPTLTNPNVTYLQAVPDLFALGRARWGHGYGLSQWGAYRRAHAGQNYRQILGHYYSAVSLQNGLDAAQPAAGLLGRLPQSTLATDRLHLAALVPNDWPARLVITASAGLSAPVTLLGDEALWHAPQPLTDTTAVTVQLWLQEQLHDQIHLSVDHTPPPIPGLQTPAVVTHPLITLTLPVMADSTPLIDTGWRWQGEALLHTVNSGVLLPDAQTPDGMAWHAHAGVTQQGVWYGPHTTVLPAGYAYRALFWLRAGQAVSSAVADQVVARLDVTDDEGRAPLGLRDLWTSDFAPGEHYQPMAVDFHLFQDPRGLEFRVAWPGLVDLALDRVEIWRLPSRSEPTLQYVRLPFYGQWGEQILTAAQMDSAGNLSQPVSRTLQLVDSEAPQVAPWPFATPWLTSTPLTISIPVTDSFSGLDITQERFVITGQAYSLTLPATFPAAKVPWQGQPLTAFWPSAPDGSYTLALQVADRAGNVRNQTYPLGIDTQPPMVTAQVNGTPRQGWYGEAVTVTLVATDTTSGVAHIDYARGTATMTATTVQRYQEPLVLATGGVHQVVHWATDQAGHQTLPQTLTVALDLAAPTVVLQQYALRANKVRLAWQITDDGSGVAQMEMQIQQGDDAWQPAPWDFTLLSTTDLDLDPERSTKVRARAQDHLGRLSDWTTIELWNAAAWLYLPIVQR